MVKRIMAFATALVLSLSVSVPSFASEQLSVPNSVFYQDIYRPYAIVFNKNTGSYVRDVTCGFYTYEYPTASGYVTEEYYMFPALSNENEYYGQIYYRVWDKEVYEDTDWEGSASALPSPGTYGVTAKWQTYDMTLSPGVAYIQIHSEAENVSKSFKSTMVDLEDGKDDYEHILKGNVCIDYDVRSVYLMMSFTGEHSDAIYLRRLDTSSFSFSFEKVSGSPTAYSVTSSGSGGVSTDDIQSDMADTMHDISEGIEEGTGQIVGAIENSTSVITGTYEECAEAQMKQAEEFHKAEMEQVEELHEAQIENDNKLHEEQLANDNANTEKVTDAVEKHGNAIIEGLKGLFIPSDDFFKTYFDDLYDWFSAKLGFLMFPIDLIIEIADIFLGSSDMDCVLTLPSFSIQDNQLWEEYSFNLTEFLEEHFAFLLTAIRFATSVALIIMFVQYCERKWEEVMAN